MAMNLALSCAVDICARGHGLVGSLVSEKSNHGELFCTVHTKRRRYFQDGFCGEYTVGPVQRMFDRSIVGMKPTVENEVRVKVK
jgi:hypothetical protein